MLITAMDAAGPGGQQADARGDRAAADFRTCRTPAGSCSSAVLATAILLMFFIWRRDPSWNKLTAPHGPAAGGLGPAGGGRGDRRAALACSSSMVALPAQPALLMWNHASARHRRRTGREAWPPACWSSGSACCQDTGVSELLTGAQVPGQVAPGPERHHHAGPAAESLGRSWGEILLKAFDLVAWYVLPVLVVFGPFRQRLGDMVKRGPSW